MNKDKFQRQLLYFLLSSKILIIGLVILHWSTGGFPSGEAFATISIIIPLFSVYITVILDDLLTENRTKAAQIVKMSVVKISYVIAIIYTIAIIVAINLRVRGSIDSIENLTVALGLIESAFGVYIGKIISTLFNKK